jgi:hypothetical protein
MGSHLFTIGPEHVNLDEAKKSRRLLWERQVATRAIGTLRDNDLGKRVYGSYRDPCVAVESDEQVEERRKNYKFQMIKPEHEDKQKRADDVGANIVKLIELSQRKLALMRELYKVYEYECRLHKLKIMKEKNQNEQL